MDVESEGALRGGWDEDGGASCGTEGCTVELAGLDAGTGALEGDGEGGLVIGDAGEGGLGAVLQAVG